MTTVRALLFFLTVLFGSTSGIAGAQSVPPPVPLRAAIPLPPLAPLTPAQVQLNTAYRTIQAAGGSNATLAARAAYAGAIARLNEGDAAGAAAEAAWARAQLPGAATVQAPRVEPIASPAGSVAGRAAPSPLIGEGAAFPAYLERARDAVLDARFSSETTRNKALVALRNAIDAWLDGDAAKSASEARRAETLAVPPR